MEESKATAKWYMCQKVNEIATDVADEIQKKVEDGLKKASDKVCSKVAKKCAWYIGKWSTAPCSVMTKGAPICVAICTKVAHDKCKEFCKGLLAEGRDHASQAFK